MQVKIRIKALSLNARDIQILHNEYPAPHAVPENVVPISGNRLPVNGRGYES